MSVQKAIPTSNMSANTVLLDFSIEPSRINDELSRKDIIKVIKENLEKYFGNLKMIYDMLVDDGYMCIFNDSSATILNVRFFNEGLITINIEYFKKEGDNQRISFEVNFFLLIFFFFILNIVMTFTLLHNIFVSHSNMVQSGSKIICFSLFFGS